MNQGKRFHQEAQRARAAKKKTRRKNIKNSRKMAAAKEEQINRAFNGGR